MKQEIDIHNEPEVALNSLLDEINKQRRITSELQSELRKIRTREIRLNKNSELLKTENNRLQQDLVILEQKLRELEIQLTLPESDRSFSTTTAIDPFPRKPLYKKINWAFIIAPILVILAIATFKWQSSQSADKVAANIALTTEGTTPSNTEGANTTTSQTNTQTGAANVPTSQAIEEGYLLIQNTLEKDGMVRVMDGYSQKAKVLAWTNPGDKYRIRAQSPTKMRRTYLKNGKNVTYEDYFYKISDKEQWVFGVFTTKKLAQ